MTDLILFLVFLCIFIYYIYQEIKRPVNFPPGPNWLPFVGNTPLIRKLARKHGGQHIVFEKLSEEFNSPVLGIKLGRELIVVALTYPMVHAVHTREEFDGRPDTFFLRLRTMGTRLGITCTDGPFWAEHRSFATKHLRQAGFGRQPMETQIQTELKELLEVIEDLHEKPEWPGTFLTPSVINVLWTFTAGKRIPRTDKKLLKLLDLLQRRSKAFDFTGGVLSQMPWLRFFAPEKTGYNLLLKFNKELNEFFMETIKEHHLTFNDENKNDDLIYSYISEMKERQNDKSSTFTDIQLTMIILDIFIAGSQTTSNTLDLALMMLLIRQDIQEKVFSEIDSIIGKNVPTLALKSNFVYTEAYLMEVQRFFHIIPITGPRRTLKKTSLGGYTIPKDTTVLIGLRTVHMDTEFWGDPEEFRPERFLDENSKIINTERLLQFGQGKRRCLGEALARACMFIFLVGILQKFKLTLPKDCDMPSTKLLPGITLSPNPYKIKFIKR